MHHQVAVENYWKVECVGEDGKLKWVEEFSYRVVTEGLNTLLNNSAVTAFTRVVEWFVGLKAGVAGDAAGDTLASHAGWTESTPYAGNRPAWTENGVASGGAASNSAAKAAFTINATATVTGAFLASVNTGTAGLLYGVGDFTTARSVISGDTLNVQVDLTAVTV